MLYYLPLISLMASFLAGYVSPAPSSHYSSLLFSTPRLVLCLLFQLLATDSKLKKKTHLLTHPYEAKAGNIFIYLFGSPTEVVRTLTEKDEQTALPSLRATPTYTVGSGEPRWPSAISQPVPFRALRAKHLQAPTAAAAASCKARADSYKGSS